MLTSNQPLHMSCLNILMTPGLLLLASAFGIFDRSFSFSVVGLTLLDQHQVVQDFGYIVASPSVIV